MSGNKFSEVNIIHPNRWVISLAALLLLISCGSPSDQLRKDIAKEFSNQEGEFALAFKNLSTGEEILIHEREKFHAASTMKTPVMVEIYRQAAEHRFSLTDSILIRNEFKSIVDSSLYSLRAQDDSEPEIYKEVGKKKTIYFVMYDMIIASSNLATNILIDLVDARKVTTTLRNMGINDIDVLRGVEDNKAFELGMNNKVTAYDLMLLFEKIGKGEAVNPEACDEMIKILLDQRFNEIIPGLLPKEVKVAHKTGGLVGLHHDSALVILPDGRRYVLVLLSRNLKDEGAAIAAMARVSRMIFDHVVR